MEVVGLPLFHEVGYPMADENRESLNFLHFGVEEVFFLILNEEESKEQKGEGDHKPHRKANFQEETLEQEIFLPIKLLTSFRSRLADFTHCEKQAGPSMRPLQFKDGKDLIENPEKEEGQGPDEKGAEKALFKSL